MSTKTTGAEYKAYMNELSAEWWPIGSYMDDEMLLINGKSTDENYDFDSAKLADSDDVVIVSGVYYQSQYDDDPINLETHFKRWRKAQTTSRFSVECPNEKMEAVKAAIKAAGGKVA